MKKIILLVSCVCAMGCAAYGAVLTPDQALSAARQSIAFASSALRAPSAPMSLQLTIGDAEPEVYVFAADNERPGFMVVSADDEAMPLLGYSADASFDPANIPPQMQWMLDCYAAHVAKLRTSAANERKSFALPSAQTRAPREPIAPLCDTKWDQEAPYWDKTPMIGSLHTYTGCVATAMAQVMKVHNWPQQGIGSCSYTFRYNRKSYTASFNFGATKFDWANMLNSYSEIIATTAQKNAVATLMSACGVVSKMAYGPEGSDGSGASDFDAAQGMIDYLNYDKGLTYQSRLWYTNSEWVDLLYSELAAGRPMLYGGQSDEGGHEFVCDGYSANDYFHFNWGWGGVSDGYFQINMLDPLEQGAGGSSGGFNSQQTALTGIQPPVEGSDYNYIMVTESASPGKSSYSILATIELFKGLIWNASLVDITNGELGIKLVSEGGSEKYITCAKDVNIEPLYGYESMTIKGASLPKGKYDVYPVFRVNGGEWKKIYCDRTVSEGYCIVNVTTSGVEITVPELKVEPDVTFKYVGRTPDTEDCYKGENYTFTYNIAATTHVAGDIYGMLIDPEAWQLKAYSITPISVDAGDSKDYDWTVEVPADLESGKYQFCLGVNQDNQPYVIEDTYVDITVANRPSTGVSSAAIDAEAPTYYDLNGRVVTHPQHRRPYIVKRAKSAEIIIR